MSEFIEEAKFKIFKLEKFGKKKYTDITLDINKLKYVFCSGFGCKVKYNNGRTKSLFWHDNKIEEEYKEHYSKDDFNNITWFDNETYDVFWEWYKQYENDFNEAYLEDNNK